MLKDVIMHADIPCFILTLDILPSDTVILHTDTAILPTDTAIMHTDTAIMRTDIAIIAHQHVCHLVRQITVQSLCARLDLL